MKRKSLIFQLLFLISGGFVVAALGVFLFADVQVKEIINQNQNNVYDEKVEAIIHILAASVEKLNVTGLRESYEVDFQHSALRTLRSAYYKNANQRIYPVIITYQGEIVMHPVLPHEDRSLQNTPYVQQIIRLKNGGINYNYTNNEAKWCRFKNFEEWNWIVVFVVPLDVKYADIRLLRKRLALILVGVFILVAVLLAIIIAKAIKPISELTKASTAMAAGDLSLSVSIDREDEVGMLARSFASMRNSIQEKMTTLAFKNKSLNREINQRKQVEIKLRDSEMKFRSLSKAAFEGILITDIEGILEVNESMGKMFGYKPSELIGMTATDLVSFELREEIQNKIMAGDEHLHETICLRKDNSIFPAEIQTKIFSYIGREVMVIAVHDVSERKKAEEALREKDKRYREVVEGTGDLVTRVNGNGHFTYVNRVGEKIMGLPLEELIGMSAFEFIHPDDQEMTQQWFEQCIYDHILVATMENRQVNKVTGDISHFLWTSNLFYDENGKLLGVNGIAHNITEQKKLERELIKSQKHEATAILAGGIAHDFNNLLAGITGYIDLALSDLGMNHRNTDYLKKAIKATMRAQKLTNKFITLSSGGTPIKRKASIKELITASVDKAFSDVDYSAELSLNEDLWQVEMDTGQMSQVFNNVLLNARESMKEVGVIQIRAENILSLIDEAIVGETLADRQFVKIEITDQGEGIPDKIMRNIFDPYFSTKERGAQKGMGLGLTVALSIVKQHDGHIVIKSEDTVGTSVYIYLPAAA